MYERIILLELNNNISSKIRPEQAASRSNHSTTQQLVNLVDTIRTNLNQKKHISSVLLDVEKTFDRVWYEGLLYKMKIMEIPINLTKIIESFLQDITFCLKIKDKHSLFRPIAADVRQGSVLAPTLYFYQ